jgi:hypothetical protein
MYSHLPSFVMRAALASRRSWIPILATLMLVVSARRMGAQGFISPFVGYNFGGDAGCPEITGCQDKHTSCWRRRSAPFGHTALAASG